MFSRFTLMLVILTITLSFTLLAEAIDIECPIIADTLLAGHSAEHNTNCGARTSLRVKGYQGIAVFRFDMSAAEGLEIEGGTMTAYCKAISGDAAGESSSESISTIAHDWIEGTGDYTADDNSATFSWPGAAISATWGDADNDGNERNGFPINVLDVINGFGGSIVNSEPIWNFTVGEWTDITLDAELAQGLVDGSQYGIVVWRDSTGVNLDLASREDAGGANAATLVVQASEASAVNSNGKVTSTWAAIKSASE